MLNAHDVSERRWEADEFACGLQLVTVGALRGVSERLRDVKRPVRREAAARLAAVFRHGHPLAPDVPSLDSRVCCADMTRSPHPAHPSALLPLHMPGWLLPHIYTFEHM